MNSDFTGFLKNSLVLVDASSIMLVSTNDNDSKLFWSNLLSSAAASATTVIIPSGVVKELDKHQSSGLKDETAIGASKRALEKLLSLQKTHEVFIVDDHINTKKEDGDVFADPYFINFVNTYKMHKNIYVITQDVNLMKDIHRTATFDSLSGVIKDANGEAKQILKQKKVVVLKVLRRGVGDSAILEAGALRKFVPDWTLADIASEVGQPVEECIAKLKELTGKDISASEKISQSYERRLKEAFGLISPYEERIKEEKRVSCGLCVTDTTEDNNETGPSVENVQISKLPEFKPVWE